MENISLKITYSSGASGCSVIMHTFSRNQVLIDVILLFCFVSITQSITILNFFVIFLC